MSTRWFGAPVQRVEDDRLLRGHGRFTDDFGDKLAFLRRYVSVPPASKTEFKYDDYDWSLNDWRR